MTDEQARLLADALREKFRAEVDVERLDSNGRFRVAVNSPDFENMAHLTRLDQVWAFVDRLLPREAVLDISLILAYAPSELEHAG